MKVAIDTNLLIYVLQGHDSFGEPARQLMTSFSKADLVASEAVFGEILSNPLFQANAAAHKQAANFLENIDISYVATTRQVYLEAATLRRHQPSLKLPDAIHLASAWLSQAEVFVTNDKQLLRFSTRGHKIVSLLDFARDLP
jgi:predicted nucleic acid-binding protein